MTSSCQNSPYRRSERGRSDLRRELWSWNGAWCALATLIAVCGCTRNAPPAASNTPAGQPAEVHRGAVGDWLTWGGPKGDFCLPPVDLADAWPSDGPPQIWSRPLGDGYSGIAVDGDVLYTAFRRGDDDVVTALQAASGETIWETPYHAPFANAYAEAVGPGPYAMPQIVGDRVVIASGNGQLLSLDKQSGSIVWSHDLYAEYDGTKLEFGYSSHALPYQDKLIVLVGAAKGLFASIVGGGDTAVIAFNQSDGAVAWRSLTFKNAHSSPMLISVDGQQQVVALAANEVVGFRPEDGALLWHYPHATGNDLAVSQPVWGADNVLIVSSAYGGGSRALELRQANGQTTVRELWHTRQAQSHHGTMIRVGDHVYLSSGQGPAFMTAVDVKTGDVTWKERGFAKAQLLLADDKFILLDEEGVLALTRATPERLEVLSQAPLLKKLAWTPPTLSGTRLYIRDRESIMALELGDSASQVERSPGQD